MALWDVASPLLLRIEPNTGSELAHARECIKSFAKVDPRSDAWRYPIDKNGAPSLPKDLAW